MSTEYNLFKGEIICYMNNCYLTTNGIAIGVMSSAAKGVFGQFGRKFFL